MAATDLVEAPSALEAAAGTSVRRRMQDRETHAYTIELAAGQYLHLTIDQRGTDLVASLAGPRGAESIEVDGLTGAWGPEEIFWRTALPGSHRLVLTGLGGTGEYTVTVEELRPATPEDAKRVEAGRRIAAGRQRRRAGDPRQAIVSYERALALWRELGDSERQGRVDCLLGRTWSQAGDAGRARAAFDRALSRLAAGDVAHRALALNNLGRLAGTAGELERSRDCYQQELVLRREIGDLSGEARAANNLGLAFDQLAESQQAMSYYSRALALWRQIGDRTGEAKTLHNRGKSYLYLGKPEQALDDFTEALALREELGDRRGQASTLSAMGQALVSGGGDEGLRRAARVYERALELAAELEDPRRQAALAENNLGIVYVRLGRSDEARAAFQRAREGFRELGLRQSEAVVLGNLGWLFSTRGETAAAMSYSRQALAAFEEVHDLPGQVDVLRTIAELEHAAGDLAAARASIERAVEAIESLRTRPVSHDLRSSYFATKQSHYDLYIRVLMDLHRREPAAGHAAAALAASERARARSLLDNLIESGADLRRGVPPDLLGEARRLEGAINAKEHQRLRLLESGAEPAAREALEKELRELLRDYDHVQARIRLASPRYAALTQPRPLEAREIQERILDRDTLLLQYDLGAERSFLWAVTPRSIASFELPPRETVEAAARRTYQLLTVSNRREGRAPTEIALAALSEMLLAPVAGLLDGKRLLVVSEGALQYIPFGALPRPAGGVPLAFDHEISHMPSSSSLAVLREQARSRPPAPGLIAVVADPVFRRHDPRLGNRDAPDDLAARTRGAGDADLQRLLEGIEGDDLPRPLGGIEGGGLRPPGGIVGGDLQFERLVYSRREAEGILGLADGGASFRAFGFDASKAMVTSGVLSRYRYVHFATHGDLNAEHPELSRLVLSLVDRRGRPRDDGFLHAHEIYNLELPADLVVLSACRTALGKEVAGEGLVGLTQGFMYAGASRVIVSLWQVNDRAAAELMVRFYELLLRRGLSPAAALREAQLSIARERPWQSPYYWAAFVLQGEW